MKKFLLRNVILIFSILLLVVLVLSTYTIFTQIHSHQVIDLSTLPGPKNKLSSRSQTELHALLGPPLEIIGGFVIRLKYDKTENPIIWYGGATGDDREKLEAMIMDYISRQTSGLNLSSAELSKSPVSLRNSQAAMIGDIACAPISYTGIPRVAPLSVNLANVICRAPIPPFDSNANMALIVLIAVCGGIESPTIQQARKVMLQLQIDIFNRDFLAREIWLHP